MTTPLPQLQSLLLDLLSPIRPVNPDAIQALNAEDWACMLTMVRQHRLGPLLHWQLARHHADLPIPEIVRSELKNNFQRAAMRTLVWQRELVLVHRILEKAAIPHVVLKGAYLACHAYPHPALRPMRDLDILVPKENALEAFQTLIDGGLARIDQYSGTPEASLEISKHFPPLCSPSKQVSVELHNRLFHPEHNGQAQADLSSTPLFWQACIHKNIADTAMPFASPTHLLLHLIIHAVFDHQFDNGPLLLSDLAFLLDTQEIDWALFWDLANQGQQRRGCLLALKLMERYWGTKKIVWPLEIDVDMASLQVQVDSAALLMLRDFDTRADVNLTKIVESRATIIEITAALLGKVFISKKAIAAQFPVSENSPLIFLRYPVRWWRLATRRLPEYLRAQRQVHVAAEVQQLVELEKWLSHKTGTPGR